MAVIPLPTGLAFSDVPDLTLARAGVEVRSKYTAQSQYLAFPYAIWVFEGIVVESDGVKAGRFRSFLAKLQGRRNTFRLPVPAYSRPASGYATDGNLQAAVASRATSVTVGGLTANRAVFSEGDYFNIGDELKLATSDVGSDANGQCTISFEPAMRNPFGSGTLVKLQSPFIYLQAQDDNVASWQLKAGFRQNSRLAAIEAIRL